MDGNGIHVSFIQFCHENRQHLCITILLQAFTTIPSILYQIQLRLHAILRVRWEFVLSGWSSSCVCLFVHTSPLNRFNQRIIFPYITVVSTLLLTKCHKYECVAYNEIYNSTILICDRDIVRLNRFMPWYFNILFNGKHTAHCYHI